MTNQNPYKSPGDGDRLPVGHKRACDITLVIVVLDVAFSAYKAVRNLNAALAAPDMNSVATGAVITFWVLWIAIELVAARLIRRGRATGRWILVASFGLKGIAQIGLAASRLPLVARSPSIALAGPWLYCLVQAICYCGATFWLLFIARLPSRFTKLKGL